MGLTGVIVMFPSEKYAFRRITFDTIVETNKPDYVLSREHTTDAVGRDLGVFCVKTTSKSATSG